MKVYTTAFLSGASRALNQPGEIAVRTVFYTSILIVFAALWDAAVDSNGGPIQGYSYAALLWYVTAAEATVVATRPRLIEDIGWAITNGSVTIDMLRPVSVVNFRIAVELGEAIAHLAFVAIVGAGFASLIVGPPPDIVAALTAIPAVLLGISCIVVAQHAFGAVAFWLEDAKSSWFLFQKLIFLLGGMLLPLELLPEWFAAIARVTPFITMAYIPARLMSGHFEPLLILIQIAWLAIMMGAATVAFAAGEKRLQGAGG